MIAGCIDAESYRENDLSDAVSVRIQAEIKYNYHPNHELINKGILEYQKISNYRLATSNLVYHMINDKA